MRIGVDRHLTMVWTAMPVSVIEDSDGHRCELQIKIKGQAEDQRSGEIKPVDISKLGKVPIQFAAGGGLTITHPIKKDDEGMVVFQSRNIEGWTEKGGQQEEPMRRRHDLSDGLYVPGVRNKPRQLDPAPSRDAVHIRVDDGKHLIEMHKDGSCTIWATKVNVHAPEVNMDGNRKTGDHAEREEQGETRVEIKGWLHTTRDITSDQNIRADQDVSARQEVTAHYGGQSVRLSTHRHSGVQSGPSTTGSPVPGS